MTITSTDLTPDSFGTSHAFTVSTSGGNKLVVAFQTATSTLSTIADSAGNTWTLATKDESASCVATYIYETLAASPSAITSITITTAGVALVGGTLYEMTGMANTSAADKVAHSHGTTTSVDSSSTATLTNNNDVEIGVAGWADTASDSRSSVTFTNGTGTDHYVDATFISNHYQAESSSRVITSSTAAQKYTMTLSAIAGSLGWTACIACFKQAAVVNPKTIDGLALASVKAIDGLAIASVKKIDGLS